MKKRLKHIGVDAFLAERKRLLDSYDQAKAKMSDDPVKVDHGTNAEVIFRDWLNSFLPKRFAATKGYIITHSLNYDGPLEEWDILIYDALEAPILFYKNSGDKGQPRQAIPIEHVRGVLEVKATLNPKNAQLATRKLTHLKHFIGLNSSHEYPEHLCEPFVCGVVFFETAVANLKTYRCALDHLSTIFQQEPLLPFMGGLILRSQSQAEHSGYLQAMISDNPLDFSDEFEFSSEFQFSTGQYGCIGCFSYSVNNYQNFIFDLLASIKGAKTNSVSSFYGLDFENVQGSRLFQ